MKTKRVTSLQRQARARNLIEKLGGASFVAKALGKSPSTIHRWTYSRKNGGTGGAIPIQLIHYIVKLSRDKKLQLLASDRELFVQIRRKRIQK